MVSLLDLPKGLAKVMTQLAQLAAQGFTAAEYKTLAVMLDQSVGHVKASVNAGVTLGLLATSGGGGRGKKATVRLTDEGKRLAAPPASVARS